MADAALTPELCPVGELLDHMVTGKWRWVSLHRLRLGLTVPLGDRPAVRVGCSRRALPRLAADAEPPGIADSNAGAEGALPGQRFPPSAGAPTVPSTHPAPDTLAAVLHDMKSPLSAIRGRAQLATRQVAISPTLADEEREKLLRHLRAVDECVGRVCEQIDGLRAGAA